MCRNIKQLRRPERAPTDEELELAALQFVRKISGYREPASVNREAFDRAVKNIAGVGRTLFEELEVKGASWR
jgi:hypothetical protein